MRRTKGTEPSGIEEPVAIYPDIFAWTRGLLIPTISRRVGSEHLRWCPQWWRHPEAVCRLAALWHAWEVCLPEGGAAMSLWWTQDFDPNFAVLSDPRRGPFEACGHGDHTGKVRGLPNDFPTAAEEDAIGHAAPRRYLRRLAGSGSEESGQAFPDLLAFVDHHLAPMVCRRVDSDHLRWCAQWWRHPEALERLGAVWNAWETCRLQGGAAMSWWWVHSFDPNFAVLSDPRRGPFEACSEEIHRDKLRTLPDDPLPPEWLAAWTEYSTPPPERSNP
jgi:hypothetical protein